MFESEFIVHLVSPHASPALTLDEVRRAIIRAINEKDSEAEHYGPSLVGYVIGVRVH